MRNAILHRVAPFVAALPLALSVVPAATRAQVVVPPRPTVVTAPKTLPPTTVAPAKSVAPAPAPASLSQSFVLGTGERTGFGFVVGSPGPIVVAVRWTGVPLIISLVKPGGISVDQQGSGSVTLQYTATADDVKKGMLWSANVRPAQPAAAPSSAVDKPIRLVVADAATGTVNVQYPAGDVNLAQAELTAKSNQALAATPAPQQLSSTLASDLAAKQAALQTAQQTRQVAILNALKLQVPAQALQQASARVAVSEKASGGPPVTTAPTKATGGTSDGTNTKATSTSAGTNTKTSGGSVPATTAPTKDTGTPAGTNPKATGTSQQAQVTSAGTNAPATLAADPSVGLLSAASGQPGDPILISGSGFSGVPGEVHFIVANGKDFVAPVSVWNDTQIFAAVPDVSGVQAYSGQMYVKRGTSSSKLVPFGFNPSMEIRTLGITNDRSAAGAAVNLSQGTVLHPTSNDYLFGHRGDDQFFASTSLKNGWTVKSAYVMGYGGGGVFVFGSGNAYVSESRQGTDSPYVKVHWWIDRNSFVDYILRVDIIGPKGVPHF
jgi:hypothetical protein